MPAATPCLCFLTLYQQEVLQTILILNAGLLCSRHFNHGNKINVFPNFRTKRHKIVENLALLTTELSNYKMCKVSMLFHIL